MILVAVGLISILSAIQQMPFWTILTSNKSGVAKLVIKGGKHNRNDHALHHILQESTDATTFLQSSNSNETNNKF
jgi:hypothetical protein